MKNQPKSQTLTRSNPSRSTALIAVAKPAPRRGLIATAVRLVAAIVVLPVRLPVLALIAMARGVARAGVLAGRGLAALGGGLLRVPVLLARLVAMPFVGVARAIAWTAPRLGRGIGALLMLPVKLVVLLARLVAMPFIGLARGAAWVAPRLGRGVALLAMLPVKLLVGIARLIGMFVRSIANAALFILRIPFVLLRLLVKGAVGAVRGLAFGVAAVAVPVGGLAWGAVRSLVAGVAAVARGIGVAIAFIVRLAARGVRAVALAVFSTLLFMATGTLACLRGTALGLLWLAVLPFRALHVAVFATARGIQSTAYLVADAARTVAGGIAELVRGGAAVARGAARVTAGPVRSMAANVMTREPQRAAFLPLVTLAVLGAMEMFTPGFPFATVGLLLLAAFAVLVLMSRPVTMGGVLLAWALALACGWRAEVVTLESPVWVDAFMYLASLAALRSAYVAARAFATDAPLAPRAAEQARAHGRAARAMGAALVAQCLAFALWSAEAGVDDAVIFGELLLVGAGAALAWVVRSGQYVRAAQAVLTVGAFAAVVGAIAAQLSAFGAGRLVTPASFGAGLMLALVTTALIVVVHARAIDTDHGA